MKKSKLRKATPGKFPLLRQLCNLIPSHLVPQLARATGVEARTRTFTPWSHVVRLLYAQFTHALGLNDVCDGLRLHAGPLSAIRGGHSAQQERPLHRQPGTPRANGARSFLGRPGASA